MIFVIVETTNFSDFVFDITVYSFEKFLESILRIIADSRVLFFEINGWNTE